MAQNSLCVFNTRYSVVTRCSRDYRAGDAVLARSHLLQSFHNMLWMGQTVWGDHDMFHSSDKFAGRMMAVSKALSGGPVYLSDPPEQIVADAVRPLCYENGRLLRPAAPAVVMPNSAMLDALNDGSARLSGNGAVEQRLHGDSRLQPRGPRRTGHGARQGAAGRLSASDRDDVAVPRRVGIAAEWAGRV